MGLPAGVEYDPNAPFNETDIVKDISVVIDGEIKITMKPGFTEEDVYESILEEVKSSIKGLGLTITNLTII